jgi:hypothetical protein
MLRCFDLQRQLDVDFVEERPVVAPALWICSAVSGADSCLFPYVARIGAGRGISFASFRRFLGGGGQQELIFGSVWTAEAQSTEPEYACQMSEEHLDLLSFET